MHLFFVIPGIINPFVMPGLTGHLSQNPIPDQVGDDERKDATSFC